MARLLWTMVCNRAVVDQFTNSVSLIDLIEEIQVPRPPAQQDKRAKPVIPLRFYVASLWSRSDPNRPERTRSKLHIVAPNGEVLANAEQEINLDSHQRMRGLMPLPMLPVPVEGEYKFIVFQQDGNRWKKMSTTSVMVRYVDQPATKGAVTVPEKVNKKRRQKVH